MEQKTSKSIRLGWTQQQQLFIKHLYEQQKILNWKEISKKFNSNFQSKNRTAKQCRERYCNYIKFDNAEPKVSDWSTKEDDILYEKYAQIGAKWVEIANLLPGKSQNCVKNRFYGSLRRLIRKINNLQKIKKIKTTYPIKYSSVLKMLEIVKMRDTGVICARQQQFLQLRNQILEKAKLRTQQNDEQIILSLINKMHSLTTLTRFISVNKGKKKNTINECRLKYLICNSKTNNSKIESQQEQCQVENLEPIRLKRSLSQELMIVDDSYMQKKNKNSSHLVCQACQLLSEKCQSLFIDQFL